MTGLSTKTRRLVADRDNGICRRCGAWAQDIQHRVSRGAGGTSRPEINTDLANLVSMCRRCHDWAENREREQARADGWVIPRSSRELPFEIPLIDVWGGVLFLTEEGTATYLPALESL